jgi:hypothetical protein
VNQTLAVAYSVCGNCSQDATEEEPSIFEKPSPAISARFKDNFAAGPPTDEDASSPHTTRDNASSPA